jgi:hypothetical protein
VNLLPVPPQHAKTSNIIQIYFYLAVFYRKPINMHTPKVSLMIVLFLAAIALGTTAAIEVALLSQSVQDVNAKGCAPGGVPYNASQGRCFK